MPEYTLTMRLSYQTTVTIEANNIEEADEKARSGEFADDGMRGAELVDWDKIGSLKECA